MPPSKVQASRTPVHSDTEPLRLPDVLHAIKHARGIAYALACTAAELDAALAMIDMPLAERIERNRRRSARAHEKTAGSVELNSNGNGHGHDVALKLTRRGLEAACRRCGKRVAS